MQISAVTPNFQGRRDRIDELINLDDQSVRRIAYLETAQKSNNNKHRKITNALIMAAPVAAGIGAAVFTKGKTKIFSTEVSGLAARLANGLKSGALWGATLGAVGLVGVAKSKLSESSAEVRKFDREHPILSLMALLAAGFGAIALTGKAAGKIATLKTPKFLKNATKDFASLLNTNKKVLAVKGWVRKLVEKTPSALKEFGSSVLAWTPQIFLLGGLLHSVNHASKVNSDFSKNYNDLKEKQLNLSKARMRELQLENDFFKQDPRNVDDLALVKNPMRDLPDEVIDKVSDLADDEVDLF